MEIVVEPAKFAVRFTQAVVEFEGVVAVRELDVVLDQRVLAVADLLPRVDAAVRPAPLDRSPRYPPAPSR